MNDTGGTYDGIGAWGGGGVVYGIKICDRLEGARSMCGLLKMYCLVVRFTGR